LISLKSQILDICEKAMIVPPPSADAAAAGAAIANAAARATTRNVCRIV
jgi:hypothetical protein